MCMRSEDGGCYHVWKVAKRGRFAAKETRCYSKPNAQSYVRNRMKVACAAKPALVLRCFGQSCECNTHDCMGDTNCMESLQR